MLTLAVPVRKACLWATSSVAEIEQGTWSGMPCLPVFGRRFGTGSGGVDIDSKRL